MPAPWLPARRAAAGPVPGSRGSRVLEAGDVAVAYTPRRLVLRVVIPTRQPDREEPVWGPSVKVAKDAAGKWTGAAHGFAKKNAVAVEDLGEGAKDPAKPGERYLLHVRKVAGRATIEVLPALLAGILRALAFPKRMSWDAWLDDGKGAFPFGRPIRWLVFLLDGEVVPFAIHALEGGGEGGGRRGDRTHDRGHRFLPKDLAGEDVVVRSWDELTVRLRERFVLLAPQERAARIESQVRAAARGARCRTTACARMARPRRVSHGAGPARCPRSSDRCRPRCSRRSSCTTRSPSRCATGRGRSPASRR